MAVDTPGTGTDGSGAAEEAREPVAGASTPRESNILDFSSPGTARATTETNPPPQDTGADAPDDAETPVQAADGRATRAATAAARAAVGGSPEKFPAKQPKINNRFTNQKEKLFDEGYDSEGELCYVGNLVDDEEEDEAYVEETIEATEATDVREEMPPPPPPEAKVGPWTEAEFQGFGTARLAEELKAVGKAIYGTKEDKRIRLRAAYAASEGEAAGTTSTEQEVLLPGPGSPSSRQTMKWGLLDPDFTPTPEIYALYRDPTTYLL